MWLHAITFISSPIGALRRNENVSKWNSFVVKIVWDISKPEFLTRKMQRSQLFVRHSVLRLQYSILEKREYIRIQTNFWTGNTARDIHLSIQISLGNCQLHTTETICRSSRRRRKRKATKYCDNTEFPLTRRCGKASRSPNKKLIIAIGSLKANNSGIREESKNSRNSIHIHLDRRNSRMVSCCSMKHVSMCVIGDFRLKVAIYFLLLADPLQFLLSFFHHCLNITGVSEHSNWAEVFAILKLWQTQESALYQIEEL